MYKSKILAYNVPYYFIKNLQGDVIEIVSSIDNELETVAKYSYDVLHYFSKKVNFSKLISQLRNTPPSFGNMIFVGGLINFANWLYNRDGRAGLSVFSIITFLKAKFFFVSYSFLITNLWGFRADLSKACIVAYLRKDGSGHYVAGINYGGRDGGYFRFYNNPDMAKSQKMSIVNYVKLLKKNGATPLFFISVNGKKGWW